MNATVENQEVFENQQQAEAQIEGFGHIGRLLDRMSDLLDQPENVYDRLDDMAQVEQEGILSVEVERTVRVVLCTGGPHCEIRWTENDTPTVVCFGWFGADRFERDLTENEQAGLEYALGNWETLAGIES